MASPFLFDKRESVARFATLLFGGVLLLASSHLAIRHEAAPAEEPIQIRLADIPEPPKPQVEPPKPRVAEPPHKVAPRQVKPSPRAPQPVSPVAAAAPAPAPVALPDAPVSPLAKTLPEKAEPAIQSNAAAEGRFARGVRTRIEQKKVYPDTARDLGMSGTVEVSYTLDRGGRLLKAEISASSGYALLDQAALKAVRSAAYQPFPEDAWVGEKQKEFRTKVVFSINY